MVLAIFAILLLVAFLALVIDWGVRTDETSNKREAWFCICLGLTFGIVIPVTYCMICNI